MPGKHTTTYGGNTTCLELTLQSGRKVIIDAGTGIRALGEKLALENERVDIHLLMTHIHWDHILAFPFFAPIYDPSTRILIDGYRTCMKGLRSTFDSKMGDGFFPIKFDEIKAEVKYLDHLKQGELEIDGTVIESVLHYKREHETGNFGEIQTTCYPWTFGFKGVFCHKTKEKNK